MNIDSVLDVQSNNGRMLCSQAAEGRIRQIEKTQRGRQPRALYYRMKLELLQYLGCNGFCFRF